MKTRTFETLPHQKSARLIYVCECFTIIEYLNRYERDMEKQTFNDMLKKAGLSKKEFGEILGTTGGTISNWGNEGREIPYWVESWLELYIENRQCRKIKEAIEQSGVCDLINRPSN